jgi:hypothetical protein
MRAVERGLVAGGESGRVGVALWQRYPHGLFFFAPRDIQVRLARILFRQAQKLFIIITLNIRLLYNTILTLGFSSVSQILVCHRPVTNQVQ